MKPKIFVGSSKEGLSIAYAVQQNLHHYAEVTVWDQGVFQLSKMALESLIQILDHSDFSIFVFTPDDITHIRGERNRTVRDNVLFELGLFVGRLGKDRSFILLPHNLKEFHLPTDLIGIMPATFEADRIDENLQAAAGPACNHIRQIITKMEPIKKNVLPKAIGKYLDAFPEFKIDYDLHAQCVKTTRESRFKAIRYIYDSLATNSEVICTDHLDLKKDFFRRYWATEGLNNLENNYEASLKGIKIKRIFILVESDIKENKSLINGLSRLHRLAGVEPMIAIYEKLPKECLYEFALFGNEFLDEARYDFRSEQVIENYIHWSTYKLIVFKEKSKIIETFSKPFRLKSLSTAQSFEKVKECARRVLQDA